MPSRKSRHSSSSPRGSKDPEIFQQLGRAVLSYSLKKLAEQRQARSEASDQDRSRSHPGKNSSSSRSRDRSSARRSHRDAPRDDGGELHTLITQLAIGALAGGVRRLIKRRRESKRKAAASSTTDINSTTRGTRPGFPHMPAVDPELSASLDFVTAELRGATDTIRRLASTSAPVSQHPTHDCAVRDALAVEADRLTASLTRLQVSIINMQNLHPALEAPGDAGARHGNRREKGNRGIVEEMVGGGRRRGDWMGDGETWKKGRRSGETERKDRQRGELLRERRLGDWDERHSRRTEGGEDVLMRGETARTPPWSAPLQESLNRRHRRHRDHGSSRDEIPSTGLEHRRSRRGARDGGQTPHRHRLDPVTVG
ncbi:hypothetical protein VTJ49DRAFT_5390 [Mycothermus thermophilus]|uniref:Uncharacterized protein n=1 Tax=Humicola insolens TaxID=85995 RepID=A0ABR3V3E5_HUMIN